MRCGERAIEANLFSKDAMQHFQQAWAEAYQGYKEGVLGRSWQLTLSSAASSQARELQDLSGIDDPRTGIIEQWLGSLQTGSIICTVQAMEEALGIPREMQKRRDQMEVSALLQSSISNLKPLDSKRRVGSYGVQRAFAIERK